MRKRLFVGSFLIISLASLVWVVVSGEFSGNPLSKNPSLDSIKMTSASSESADLCLSDPEVIGDIKKREETLRDKEKALEAREKSLNEKELALSDYLGRLELLKKEIAGYEGQIDSKREEKVSKLVETFEKMSPKAASKILASVELNLAIEAMQRIETQKLAKMMNLMDAKDSTRLTESLLSRKKNRGLASIYKEKLPADALTEKKAGNEEVKAEKKENANDGSSGSEADHSGK